MRLVKIGNLQLLNHFLQIKIANYAFVKYVRSWRNCHTAILLDYYNDKVCLFLCLFVSLVLETIVTDVNDQSILKSNPLPNKCLLMEILLHTQCCLLPKWWYGQWRTWQARVKHLSAQYLYPVTGPRLLMVTNRSNDEYDN